MATRRAPRSRRPSPKPAPAFTRLSPLPPRSWAAAPAASHILPQWLAPAPHAYASPDWWQGALEAQDATAAAFNARIDAVNNHVASLANPLDLGVKRVEGVLTFDALEMARRIEQAAAQHKNRQRSKARSDNQNRNLKYLCPTCQRPLRSAGSSRIIMCGGTFEAPHTPAVCTVEEMPANRAADLAAAQSEDGENTAAPSLKTGDQSRAQQDAFNRKLQARMDALGAPTVSAPNDTGDSVIPF